MSPTESTAWGMRTIGNTLEQAERKQFRFKFTVIVSRAVRWHALCARDEFKDEFKSGWYRGYYIDNFRPGILLYPGTFSIQKKLHRDAGI